MEKLKGIIMNKALGYLQEVVSCYSEKHTLASQLLHKIRLQANVDVLSFVHSLSEEEVQFLNDSLPDEMKHALKSEDFPRLEQLNEVYELL